MSGIEDLKEKLTLPPISQIGVVVKNVEKTGSFLFLGLWHRPL